MARSLLDPVLRDVPPFDQCSSRELRIVAPLLTTVEVPAETVLMRQGDNGSTLFVVVAGIARASRDGRTVAELGRGDVVGELAIIVDAPRSATVVASTAMTLAEFAPGSFAVLFDECPTITHAVLRTAIQRLAPAA
jgi:NTE family protein